MKPKTRVESSSKQELAADQIEVKFRTKDRRSEVRIVIGQAEQMVVAMKEYAAKKGVPVASLNFVFDGEPLSPKVTPEELELEGGECIDVH